MEKKIDGEQHHGGVVLGDGLRWQNINKSNNLIT